MSGWQGSSPVGRSGRALAESLRAGAQPHHVSTRLHLEPDEFCVGEIPVTVHQFIAGDGSYVHKTGGYIIGGSAAGMILGGAFSAVRLAANVTGNQMREWRAAREAALRWRPVDAGLLYLTNRRFAVQGAVWSDLWFRDIRLSGCDPEAVELHIAGSSPVRLEMAGADYWFVMFNKLAFDTVVDVPEHRLTLPKKEPAQPRGAPSRVKTSEEIARLFGPPPEAPS